LLLQKDTKPLQQPTHIKSTANPSTSRLDDPRLAHMEETTTLVDVVESTAEVVVALSKADQEAREGAVTSERTVVEEA
jgi:hypothetical protein